MITYIVIGAICFLVGVVVGIGLSIWYVIRATDSSNGRFW